jgi:DNA repair ATPase RecN
MSVGLRVLGVLAVVLGIAGLVLSVAGIGFVWVARARWTPKVLHIVGEVQRALTLVEEHVGEAAEAVENTRQRVVVVRGAVDALAEGGPKAQELAAVVRQVDEQVFSRFTRLRALVGSSETTAEAANGSLALIQAIPFVSLLERRLSPEQKSDIEQAAERVNDLAEVVADARTALSNLDLNSDEFRARIDRAAVSLERIDVGLQEAGTLIETYGPTIPETIEKLDRLEERIPRWMTVGAIAATVLLVWLAVAQFSLLIHGLAIVRG